MEDTQNGTQNIEHTHDSLTTSLYTRTIVDENTRTDEKNFVASWPNKQPQRNRFCRRKAKSNAKQRRQILKLIGVITLLLSTDKESVVINR